MAKDGVDDSAGSSMSRRRLRRVNVCWRAASQPPAARKQTLADPSDPASPTHEPLPTYSHALPALVGRAGSGRQSAASTAIGFASVRIAVESNVRSTSLWNDRSIGSVSRTDQSSIVGRYSRTLSSRTLSSQTLRIGCSPSRARSMESIQRGSENFQLIGVHPIVWSSSNRRARPAGIRSVH